MLTPDLLHQVIKGTFKDHLVGWVMEWLILENGEARANEIVDDIDRRSVHCSSKLVFKQLSDSTFRIVAVPLFPELHHIPHGCRFKQWTGDDSKALMKVIYFIATK